MSGFFALPSPQVFPFFSSKFCFFVYQQNSNIYENDWISNEIVVYISNQQSHQFIWKMCSMIHKCQEINRAQNTKIIQRERNSFKST